MCNALIFTKKKLKISNMGYIMSFFCCLIYICLSIGTVEN